MIFDLFERSDRNEPRPKTFGEALMRFGRDVMSDTLTTVLVSIILGLIAVTIVSFYFGISFMTSLAVCAVLLVAFFVMNVFSNF
ncbi:hypothetical protein TRP8649_01081 [Pelagimonas phthalicica]|uniref:Uncharacterized protein n=1 Tax=Pelagimonas phthalicica TaxID=1037362 RepID=A0A238J8D2_9RHOB|nr:MULTISPECIES: hypothetical protein [Roseobacteraceae]MBO9466990.1 hypothetical protein [Tropicibacter sp. R15_0]TDS94491.1 hypothetical protein CLV87_0991 [Pelagimonas phthalicica]SMX26980.1 hypothetical protein TRP8649_01081 [Pelagimonas phthalicica]